MLVILKALIPLLKDMCFGKEDPLVVLTRNKTSSVLVVTCALLAVMVCGMIYIYINLFNEHSIVLKKQADGLVVVGKSENLIIRTEDRAKYELLMESIQRIEMKVTALQQQCTAPSNNTSETNSTESFCQSPRDLADVGNK